MKLSQFREAIGHRYLSFRPSYARCLDRLGRKAPELVSEFTRETYETLLSEIRRLEALLKEAAVDTDRKSVV